MGPASLCIQVCMCVCVYQSINADAVPLRMRSYVTSNCRECPGKYSGEICHGGWKSKPVD